MSFLMVMVMPWTVFAHNVLPGDLLTMSVDLCNHCQRAFSETGYVEQDD